MSEPADTRRPHGTGPATSPPVRYAELHCASHFSFLRGASSGEELFAAAAEGGLEALAITDLHSLAGIVRAHEAAKVTGVRLIVGCRLDLTDGATVLVYPEDRAAYGRLCRLLTLGKLRGGKGQCHLGWDDLAAHAEGLWAVLVPDEPDARCAADLRRLRDVFGDRASLALTLRRRPRDQLRLYELARLAAEAGVRPVATGDVLYHHSRRRVLQEVMTCIRHGCTLDALGHRRERFADRHLKSAAEMYRLYAATPEALARGIEIAARCRFSLDELAYQYPEEATIPGLTPQAALERLTWEGAAERYPEGVPEEVEGLLHRELALIGELAYAPYFLTVHSIVHFARSRGILCQGRGSAANSAVCFALGITSIDPERSDLLFERFVSAERREPPDIDVDFEHERREEVIQWVYQTYGREHAALCATVIRYRVRGALRDVGKALGLSEDLLKALSSQVWGWAGMGVEMKHAAELHLDVSDRRLRLTLELAQELIGTPRHLSQHPGGFVLTRDRLDELVPIEPAAMAGRQVIEWDKDDIDALRFMKVDCLALGMLSCLRRGLDLLAEHKEVRLDLATIPPEDPRTYAMIRRADTLGVFQIESRAQMAMLPRVKPRTFYDLVVEVAIVRPGPIQGDMVHPYLRRREGREPVRYPTPELERVLGKTLGVPLFQEQAMRVAIECAGFSPGEADQLRRAMATFKFTGGVSPFHDKLVSGMVARGYTPDFAAQTFRQLEGFGSYGFPESHAASFALLAYASSWLKCWHADVFCAALLNSQPMGFYAPAQIVRDAREHGVEVRPVCVNASRWDCTLEPRDGAKEPEAPATSTRRGERRGDGLGRWGRGPAALLRQIPGDRFAVRLGLRLVAGLSNADAARLVAARGERPFASVDDLWRQAGLPVASLVKLARADAFRPALGLARREALWALKGLRDEPLPLFAAATEREEGQGGGMAAPEAQEPGAALRPMPAGREVVEDYRHTRLTLRRHPVAFLREDLARRRVLTCAEAGALRDRRPVRTAGLVLLRQKPGSASGVVFLTIEDETGVANLVIWPQLVEAQRREVLSARMLGVEGQVQREGEVVHIVARRLHDLSGLLDSLGERDGAEASQQGRGEEQGGGPGEHAHR
ncbi:error-prone DNA polymerase, partial [Rubellimicrobium mesophilum]|uniref:error-prone DNA polymerase n=1 Tax=Rubellimicrobium mesophilum TaxID=1123067 RepID=UPI00068529FF